VEVLVGDPFLHVEDVDVQVQGGAGYAKVWCDVGGGSALIW
jgi:hypothetical protein